MSEDHNIEFNNEFREERRAMLRDASRTKKCSAPGTEAALIDENERLRARVGELEMDVAELKYLDSEASCGADLAAEEIERLKTRIFELEAHCNLMRRLAEQHPQEKAIVKLANSVLSDKGTVDAFILLKQAEAVEEMCSEWKDEAQWIINGRHAKYQRYYAKLGKECAQKLRNQAAELEKQS